MTKPVHRGLRLKDAKNGLVEFTLFYDRSGVSLVQKTKDGKPQEVLLTRKELEQIIEYYNRTEIKPALRIVE